MPEIVPAKGKEKEKQNMEKEHMGKLEQKAKARQKAREEDASFVEDHIMPETAQAKAKAKEDTEREQRQDGAKEEYIA